MIVTRLAELAARTGLVDDLAFESKRVHALLRVDRAGRLLGVLPQLDERGHVRRFLVPAQKRRTQGITPYFLCDTVEYVLGSSTRATVGARRLRQMNDAFRELVGRAAEATDDPGLRAVAAFYGVPNVLPAFALSAGARIAFILDGDEAPVFSREAARSWWRSQDAGIAPLPRRCVLTGDPLEGTATSTIWHLPRAHIAGASLMTHNLASACSHGWYGHDNAPVSARVSTASARALDHLLHGERPTRDHIGLGSATAVVWSHDSNPLTDALRTFWHHGVQPAASEDVGRIGLLVLAAETTRAIVRSFDELDARVALESTKTFADQTRLDGCGRAPRELLRALCPRGDELHVPTNAAIDLCRAVFTGRPLSWRLLDVVIGRCGKDRTVELEHAALIRFYFERRRDHGLASETTPMTLDPARSQVGYRLGRAFALLEMLEAREHRCALRHRHYQAASIRPAATLPALIRSVLSRDDGTPLATELGEILAPMDEMPRLLSLEDQGQFALGYFHQRRAA